MSGALVRERPDPVARYLTQVLRAARWTRSHRAETAHIVAREVSVADEWLPDSFDDSLIDVLEPGLRPELVDALKVRKDFMLSHGFIDNDFDVDVDAWIEPGPLRAAHALLAQRDGQAEASAEKRLVTA